MAITLSDYVLGDKCINWEIDEFFINKCPDTLKKAIKLVFRYYLDYDHNQKNKGENHPHIERLLSSMEKTEIPELSEFCKTCRALKSIFDIDTEDVKATWEQVKDFSFERAIAAVSEVYMASFIEPDFIIPKESCLTDSCSDYLNEYRNEISGFKDIGVSSWENFDKNVLKELSDDTWDREEVVLHIAAINRLNCLRKIICELFVFDKTFRLDVNTGNFSYDKSIDYWICLKERLLNEYYRTIGKRFVWDNIEQNTKGFSDTQRSQFIALRWAKYVGYPMLRNYYGISDKFKYNDIEYDLQSLLIHDNLLTDHWEYAFHNGNWNITPINAFTCSKESSGTPYGNKEQYLKVFSTDLSDKSQKIDLNLSNILYYGDSGTYFIFTHIRATKGISYLPQITFLKRKTKYRNGNEVLEESKCIENTVTELFKYNAMPMFFDAKVENSLEFYDLKTKEKKGDIDVSIYDKKTKTLILIEVKSTYVAEGIEDSFEHRKCLMYAGYQLDKAIGALEVDADLRKNVTGDQKIEFSDLKIETLIISTSFEFDGERFYSCHKPEGHRKISLLELIIRASGTAIFLILDSIFQSIKDKQNIDLKKELDSVIKNLLPYRGDAPIDDFLKALDVNIWEKILPYC
jgi:hypothetical protein